MSEVVITRQSRRKLAAQAPWPLLPLVACAPLLGIPSPATAFLAWVGLAGFVSLCVAKIRLLLRPGRILVSDQGVTVQFLSRSTLHPWSTVRSIILFDDISPSCAALRHHDGSTTTFDQHWRLPPQALVDALEQERSLRVGTEPAPKGKTARTGRPPANTFEQAVSPFNRVIIFIGAGLMLAPLFNVRGGLSHFPGILDRPGGALGPLMLGLLLLVIGVRLRLRRPLENHAPVDLVLVLGSLLLVLGLLGWAASAAPWASSLAAAEPWLLRADWAYAGLMALWITPKIWRAANSPGAPRAARPSRYPRPQ